MPRYMLKWRFFEENRLELFESEFVPRRVEALAHAPAYYIDLYTKLDHLLVSHHAYLLDRAEITKVDDTSLYIHLQTRAKLLECLIGHSELHSHLRAAGLNVVSCPVGAEWEMYVSKYGMTTTVSLNRQEQLFRVWDIVYKRWEVLNGTSTSAARAVEHILENALEMSARWSSRSSLYATGHPLIIGAEESHDLKFKFEQYFAENEVWLLHFKHVTRYYVNCVALCQGESFLLTGDTWTKLPTTLLIQCIQKIAK